MKIKCGRCDEIVRVSGKVWEYRLRHSDPGEKGNYTGWNCDSCAEAREMGMDY